MVGKWSVGFRLPEKSCIDNYNTMYHNNCMNTIIETPVFRKKSDSIWSVDERLEFFSYLSINPLAGVVIPDSGGLRKIRWHKSGRGKRGGVRVIYFNLLQNGQILVLDLYEKSEKEDLTMEEKRKLERLKDE